MGNYNFSNITPAIRDLSEMGLQHNTIAPELFAQYQVKRGLRDENGRGVLTGLTNVSDVVATRKEGDALVPAPGELYYRGVNVREHHGEYLRMFERCHLGDRLRVDIVEEIKRIIQVHLLHAGKYVLRLFRAECVDQQPSRGLLAPRRRPLHLF